MTLPRDTRTNLVNHVAIAFDTGARHASPQTVFRRPLFQPLFAACWLILYGILLVHFTPFISEYGDARAYVLAEGFSIWGYQPLWPWVSGHVYRTLGADGLFWLQALFYALATRMVFRVSYPVSKSGAYTAAALMLFNMRAYFLIANPLTEMLNLLWFCVGWRACCAVTDLKMPTLMRTGAFVSSLLLILVSRASNVMFIAALAALLAVRALRQPSRGHVTALAGCTLVLVFGAAWFLALQRGENNTGINLARFVVTACESGDCARGVFDSDASPITREWMRNHSSLRGVEEGFAEKGHSVWSVAFAREMKVVYRRLLMHSPAAFVHNVARNYRAQVVDTYMAGYPEDPNLKLLARLRGALWAHLTNAIAMLAALLAPLVVLPLLVSQLRNDGSTALAWPTAWLVSELFATLVVFSCMLIGDANRMRFHYEIPAVWTTIYFVPAIVTALRVAQRAAALKLSPILRPGWIKPSWDDLW